MNGLLQKQKREKKKQNNNNWSDDEKDDYATCKKCPAKLPKNTDERLCTSCLFIQIRPQKVIKRCLTQSEKLEILRKRANERLKGKSKDIEKHDDEQDTNDAVEEVCDIFLTTKN